MARLQPNEQPKQDQSKDQSQQKQAEQTNLSQAARDIQDKMLNANRKTNEKSKGMER